MRPVLSTVTSYGAVRNDDWQTIHVAESELTAMMPGWLASVLGYAALVLSLVTVRFPRKKEAMKLVLQKAPSAIESPPDEERLRKTSRAELDPFWPPEGRLWLSMQVLPLSRVKFQGGSGGPVLEVM